MLTVLHSTHLVSRVLYDAISRNAGTRDVYRLLRAPQGHLEVPVAVAVQEIERLRARLGSHPEFGAEHPQYLGQSAAEKLDTGIRGLSTYHTRPIVERTGETLQVKDVKLLYYYQNRTAHMPVEATS
jgi:glycerol-3-phosphate O-acyltransferase